MVGRALEEGGAWPFMPLPYSDSLQLEGVAEEGDAPPGTSPSALPISCDDPPMAPGEFTRG